MIYKIYDHDHNNLVKLHDYDKLYNLKTFLQNPDQYVFILYHKVLLIFDVMHM
jgi:hypothetical protein